MLTSNPESIRSFLAHSSQIDLPGAAPGIRWTKNGLVTGAPDPTVLKRAQDDKVPVMPIIALFNKKGFHALALNQGAQALMNEAMIRESKLHGYAGFQFDLENVDWIDRDVLTALIKRSAEAMHKAGLQLSIATAYLMSQAIQAPVGLRSGSTLIGAALTTSLNLRNTYRSGLLDDYTISTPRWTLCRAPVAGWGWTVENLDYALKVVPKEKLSLGIPLYGYHWFTGAPTKESESASEKPNPTADYIGTANALQLATAYNGKIQWDAEDHSAYFYFYRDQMREWIFFTDLHTFKDRYELVQKDGLQGILFLGLGRRRSCDLDIPASSALKEIADWGRSALRAETNR